jgi:arylsulfatase A-like enzyme
MSRRAAALALLLAACGGAPAERPDVVLITLDGLRRDHLSAFGYERQTSPNIDRLAAGGLKFPTIVPTGCSTPTSLTSLLTATGATAHGVRTTGGGLAPDVLTLAEVFQRAGYATAGFTATGWLAAKLGYGRGFEHYDDFSSHRTDLVRVGDAVVQHVESRRDDPRPQFVYVHFKEPHPPWVHAEPWAAPSPKPARPFGEGCKFVPSAEQFDAVSPEERADLVARYDATIRAADAQIGRIVAALEATGRLRRAVVAIGTDHGFELFDRYSATHGRNPFDEVVRTFLVLYDGRGGLPHPDTEGIQGRIHDIGPTLLGRAGIERPAQFEGLDLLAEADELPELAFTRCAGAFSVRSLDWKLVGIDFSRRWRTGRAPANGTYLYDLRADPGERRDVKQDEPRAYARLREASGALAEAAGTTDEDDHIPETLDDDTKERLRALGYGE